MDDNQITDAGIPPVESESGQSNGSTAIDLAQLLTCNRRALT